MSHLAPIIGVVKSLLPLWLDLFLSLLRSQRSNKVAVKQESTRKWIS